MSMLDRYKKKGGLRQLLALMETCAPAKQEKFLQMIRAEDARWADVVQHKMLDVNRIYSWDDDTIAEIVGTLQDLTLATLAQAANPTTREKLLRSASHSRKNKLAVFFERAAPSPGEVASMQMKLIETVRKMSNDGYIRFEKVDPELKIDDELEEQLIKPPHHAHRSPTAKAEVSTTSSSLDFRIEYEEDGSERKSEATATNFSIPTAESFESPSTELLNLRKRIEDLSKENATLRHELSVARHKLEQIKKIA